MTTPSAPPATTTESFRSVLWPHDTTRILDLLIGGSPFANILSRYPTARNAVAFPTAAPDRPAWVPEMGEIPVVGLNDDADIVATCKLASVILLSNESIDDAETNLTNELANLLRDSASAELDNGCLYGEGSPAPRGVVASAPAATGTDLAAALTDAIGSIGDAGGAATHLCARPSVLAAARNTRATDGQLVYGPEGLGPAFGLEEVGVPGLQADDILVLDQTRVRLILRNDFIVDVSGDFAFTRDAAAVRLRGRFAVAAPDLPKSLRKLKVSAEPGKATAAKTRATA